MPYLTLFTALLLAMAAYSNAAYCVCNTALSDSVLQKNIDYACGAGADCAQISQNGACFNPNTVKDHCNYAVNSYYQRKNQAPGACDFSGTAAPSQTPPSGAISACYSGTSTPASPGTGTGTVTPPSGTGTATPPPGTGTATPPPGTGTGTPGTGTGTPGTGTGTPGTGTGTGTPGTGTGTGTGMGTGINVNPPMNGLGPVGTNGLDNSGSVCIHQITKLSSLLVLGLTVFRVMLMI